VPPLPQRCLTIPYRTSLPWTGPFLPSHTLLPLHHGSAVVLLHLFLQSRHGCLTPAVAPPTQVTGACSPPSPLPTSGSTRRLPSRPLPTCKSRSPPSQISALCYPSQSHRPGVAKQMWERLATVEEECVTAKQGGCKNVDMWQIHCVLCRGSTHGDGAAICTSHHKFDSSLLSVSFLLLCRKPVPSPTNQSHSYESCHKLI
jgi:hypothetical protein